MFECLLVLLADFEALFVALTVKDEAVGEV